MSRLSSTILFLLLIYKTNGNEDFTYEGIHGPQHWSDKYNQCIGKHQSPINIEEHFVINVTLPSLVFSGIDRPQPMSLSNNGHTVMLKLNESESVKISGGPLGFDVYNFEQLHFHWGQNDSIGSEDLINNHSFAMELHIVFYKSKYESFLNAIHHPDGLTVLAYFFEASEQDNPVYDDMVSVLPNIENVGSTIQLPNNLILKSIVMPDQLNLDNYFTYNGSLTTPPCSEVVTWIDFKNPLLLSHKQIEAFRNIKSVEGMKLTHNFRPVQPIEDRQIFHNVPPSAESLGNPRTQVFFSLAVASVVATIPPEIWTGMFSLLS